MNKLAVVVLMAILLSGCLKRETREIGGSYALPPELQDCGIFKLTSDDNNADTLYALRCPNSTTTTDRSYRSGKTTRHVRTIIVDGVTYEEKVDVNEDQKQSNVKDPQ